MQESASDAVAEVELDVADGGTLGLAETCCGARSAPQHGESRRRHPARVRANLRGFEAPLARSRAVLPPHVLAQRVIAAAPDGVDQLGDALGEFASLIVLQADSV